MISLSQYFERLAFGAEIVLAVQHMVNSTESPYGIFGI